MRDEAGRLAQSWCTSPSSSLHRRMHWTGQPTANGSKHKDSSSTQSHASHWGRSPTNVEKTLDPEVTVLNVVLKGHESQGEKVPSSEDVVCPGNLHGTGPKLPNTQQTLSFGMFLAPRAESSRHGLHDCDLSVYPILPLSRCFRLTAIKIPLYSQYHLQLRVPK